MKKAQTDKYWQVYDEIKKINVKAKFKIESFSKTG